MRVEQNIYQKFMCKQNRNLDIPQKVFAKPMSLQVLRLPPYSWLNWEL